MCLVLLFALLDRPRRSVHRRRVLIFVVCLGAGLLVWTDCADRFAVQEGRVFVLCCLAVGLLVWIHRTGLFTI